MQQVVVGAVGLAQHILAERRGVPGITPMANDWPADFAVVTEGAGRRDETSEVKGLAIFGGEEDAV